MKQLNAQFRKSGCDYTQIFREGMVAIYRQQKQGQSWEAFEVGRIRNNPARVTFGKEFEASESWPSSEEWGIRAWSYPDLASAKRKTASLLGSND